MHIFFHVQSLTNLLRFTPLSDRKKAARYISSAGIVHRTIASLHTINHIYSSF